MQANAIHKRCERRLQPGITSGANGRRNWSSACSASWPAATVGRWIGGDSERVTGLAVRYASVLQGENRKLTGRESGASEDEVRPERATERD